MRRRFKSSEYPIHFVSGYIRHRIPLFQQHTEFADLFLEALSFYRRNRGLRIFGYVVMPDHYHLLLGIPEKARINDFLRDFKSYLGKQIVQQLTSNRAFALLDRFQLSRPRRRRRDPTYAIFQRDNDDRVIFSERFFRQKLAYIHNNPAKKGLVEVAADYRWSSCQSYLTGEAHPISLDSWA